MDEPPSLDRIEALIDRRILVLQTLIFQMLSSRDEALKIQAIEYERRLSLLNGEHDTLINMREDYVLRLVYNKDMDRMRDEANAARAAVEDQRRVNELAAAQNRRNTIGWIIAGMIALVGWGLTVALDVFGRKSP